MNMSGYRWEVNRNARTLTMQTKVIACILACLRGGLLPSQPRFVVTSVPILDIRTVRPREIDDVPKFTGQVRSSRHTPLHN